MSWLRKHKDSGAIGCQLEDSFPANGTLRTTVDQVHRIGRARQAADTTNVGFFINARTDVFERPPEPHDDAMVVEAIDRTRAYAEASADRLFAPGRANVTLIARLASGGCENSTPSLAATYQAWAGSVLVAGLNEVSPPPVSSVMLAENFRAPRAHLARSSLRCLFG